MEKELLAARADAVRTRDELIQYNTQRFSLLRQFIQEQEASNAELQNMIDLLRKDDPALLSLTHVDIAALASDASE